MPAADVYKQRVLAARIDRGPGQTRFIYLPEYLAAGGAPVATTLPLTSEPRLTPPGSVPPYFAGQLPEGRRLTALARHLKISLDDEFALLAAVGANAIGDVWVVREGADAQGREQPIDLPPALDEVSFAELATGIPELAAIAGVQEKVTGRMISLPAKMAGNEYILKLNPPEFPRLAENEMYFLALAGRCGLPHANAQLVHDRDGEVAILVTRFDRGPDEAMFAIEDGCQALDRWPADKYEITSEQLASGLAANCAAESVALRNLFAQIAFAVVTGNGDAHAKNFSIREVAGEWRVAPAYDIPSSVFYGDFTLALSIGGGKQPPSRRRLLEFADTIGLPKAAAARTLDAILKGTGEMVSEIENGAIEFDETRLRTGLKQLRYRRKQLLAAS